MKWKSLVKVALKSIMKNRMRSFLTMLGIIIGVASVIALISVGRGTQADISGKIESMGTTLLMVMSGASGLGGVSRGAGSWHTLTLADADRIEKEATLVKQVSPVIRESAQVIAGRNNWFTSVQGVTQNYTIIRSWPIERGAFFTDRDVKTMAKVALPRAGSDRCANPPRQRTLHRRRRAEQEGAEHDGSGPGRHHSRARYDRSVSSGRREVDQQHHGERRFGA
jgi:ABC-type antimicrobial peptide transport system permease subunit